MVFYQSVIIKLFLDISLFCDPEVNYVKDKNETPPTVRKY